MRAAWGVAAVVFVGLLFLVLGELRGDARAVADWLESLLARLRPPARVTMGRPVALPPTS